MLSANKGNTGLNKTLEKTIIFFYNLHIDAYGRIQMRTKIANAYNYIRVHIYFLNAYEYIINMKHML